MENPNYEQIVSEAAKWLDGVEPGWYKKIDRKILNLSTYSDCIYGQLRGGYVEGLRYYKHFDELGAWKHFEAFTKTTFSAAVFRSHCESLTPHWLAEISARLEADKRQAAKSAEAFIARTNEIINQSVEEVAR